MVLSNGLTRGVLLAVFLIAPVIASSIEYGVSSGGAVNFSTSSDYCIADVGGSCDYDVPSGYVVIQEWSGSPYTINNTQKYRRYWKDCPQMSSGWYLYATDGSSPTSSNATKCWYSETPPPEPECEIPAGTEQRLAVPYKMGSVCHNDCQFSNARKTVCVFLNTGESTCLSTYTSTGEYCDNESNSDPASPFETYTDEEGCYHSTDGFRYCESPSEAPCPNYTVIEGNKYCRASGDPEENFDSDGDGVPDSEDPAPSNPDRDGDGVNDGDDYNPDNPDSDGDGDPDGSDPDANGNGIPDEQENPTGTSEYTDGLCDHGTQVSEPECTSELDDIQCAIFLNNWHMRCEAKKQWEDLYGRPDDPDVQSLQSEGSAYFDSENPANQLPSSEPGADGVNTIDFSESMGELDDAGFITESCPAPINYSVYGTGFQFSYQPICDVLSKLHDVVVALGWFAAALIIGRSITGS